MTRFSLRSVVGYFVGVALLVLGSQIDGEELAAASPLGRLGSSADSSAKAARADRPARSQRARRENRKRAGKTDNGKGNGHGNANGEGNGNQGNGNAFGHGNGNGGGQGHGNNGNGNNGNGNGNGGGQGQGNSGQGNSGQGNSGQGNSGQGNSGQGQGQATPGTGNANGEGGGQGQGNSGQGQGQGTPGNGNANGEGNGTQGNGNAFGHGNENAYGHTNEPANPTAEGDIPSRDKLARYNEYLNRLGERAREFHEIYLAALERGDREAANAALKAVKEAVKEYFETLAVSEASAEFLDATEQYVDAVADGDESRAADAYYRAGLAFSKTTEAAATQLYGDLAPATQPEVGSTVGVAPTTGVVSVKLPGEQDFAPLVAGASVPVGTVVDARYGKVELTSATGEGDETQSAVFHGSLFVVRYRDGRRPVTELALRGGDFSGCSNGSQPSALSSLARSGASRRLWGKGKGRFLTRGNHGLAAVRGTHWLTEDRCDGTLISVRSGVVEVRDFAKRRTVTVGAGDRYLARAERK